ncbi:ABC transporter ATP-binding protein [Rhodococcus sp. NPDC058514]|uniref:ABC transporter ATP-binding protein n=1 Tax=unclassified Rhodococcus (in: high G+C Gram-positive bacteria) TaxID=192944 RepID=UPI00365693BE
MTGTPLLSVQGLGVEFLTHGGWTPVLQDVSFDVRPGDLVGLVGESGSGKSVTCSSVLRLLPPSQSRVTGGRILFEGADLLAASERDLGAVRGNDIAMIFQEPMTSLNPVYTVGDQIAEVVRRHRGVGRKQALARAVEVLDLVGIPNAARRVKEYPHEFSGGMRQRVMIAMALACEPKLLIADEPTTALDVTIQAQVLDLIREMAAQFEMGVLFVTHDLGVVADLCTEVVVMYAGQVVERAGTVDLYDAPRHPYTEGLLKSVPSIDGRADLHTIPGSPPVPGSITSGCRFAPRCSYRDPVCDNTVVLGELGGGRLSRCTRVEDLVLEGCA